MLPRIALVAGMVVAFTTAIYVVRPSKHSPNAYQIDMQAAEFCQQLALGAVRGKTKMDIVREKIKTPPNRDAERHVGILVRAGDEHGRTLQHMLDCHASWTETDMLLLNFRVTPLVNFDEDMGDDWR